MNKQILIVEDDVAIRELLSLMLTDEGYRVAEAENGHQALTWLDGHRPALLVFDLMMPGMDGLTLLARLRVREWWPLPALAMTASPRAFRQAKQVVGEANCFSKPFDFDLFLERIEELIGTP